MCIRDSVETSQRSNEQLVKLAALIQKEDSKSKESFNFSANDKNDIYDMIQSGPDTEEKEK